MIVLYKVSTYAHKSFRTQNIEPSGNFESDIEPCGTKLYASEHIEPSGHRYNSQHGDVTVPVCAASAALVNTWLRSKLLLTSSNQNHRKRDGVHRDSISSRDICVGSIQLQAGLIADAMQLVLCLGWNVRLIAKWVSGSPTK